MNLTDGHTVIDREIMLIRDYLYSSIMLPSKLMWLVMAGSHIYNIRLIKFLYEPSYRSLSSDRLSHRANRVVNPCRRPGLCPGQVQKVYTRGMSAGTIGRGSHLLAFEQLDPADVGEPVLELLVVQVWPVERGWSAYRQIGLCG